LLPEVVLQYGARVITASTPTWYCPTEFHHH
jgi:hypothetical protein